MAAWIPCSVRMLSSPRNVLSKALRIANASWINRAIVAPPDRTWRDEMGLKFENQIGGGEYTVKRLNDQIEWYDIRGARNKLSYVVLRAASIILAAFIPVAVVVGVPSWGIAVIGSIVAVLVGLESLGQFHENWIRYRSTCEALKSEKHFYVARVGPYATVRNPEQLLATRLERLLAHERSRWLAAREVPDDTKPSETR